MRRIGFVILILALVFAVGCGGSSSSTPSTPTAPTTPTTTTVTSTPGGNTIAAAAINVAPLIVNAGPVPSNPQVNVAFTTVTVCAPGSTSNCQTIPNIAVDTGSSGLRIPISVLNTAVLTQLSNVNPSTPVAECIQFLDNSFFFGTVRVADVRMGGPNGNGSGISNTELASSVPIHVMGDTSIPTGSSIPTTCSQVPTGTGSKITGTEEDSVTALGANGLLGVGNYQYDCDFIGYGNACTSSSTLPPGTYYNLYRYELQCFRSARLSAGSQPCIEVSN